MDIKQILDDELKRRKEDDILAGSRFAPGMADYGQQQMIPDKLTPAAAYGPLGGKGAKSVLPPAYLAAPMHGVPAYGSLLGHQMRMPVGQTGYGGMPGSMPGSPGEQINVSYVGADGMALNMSASYAPGQKGQAVATVMGAMYQVVMGGGYKGAKGGTKGAAVGGKGGGK